MKQNRDKDRHQFLKWAVCVSLPILSALFFMSSLDFDLTHGFTYLMGAFASAWGMADSSSYGLKGPGK